MLLTLEADRLRQDLAELQARTEYYAASRLSQAVPGNRGTDKDWMDRHIIAKEALEAGIAENMHKLLQERMRIEGYLNKILDLDSRLITRLRLVNGLSWEEIGEKIHMDRRTAARKYRQAVEKLET